MSQQLKHRISPTQQRGGRGGADLAPPGLDHELSGQVGGGLWLQRPDHDAFIQRVTGNDLKEDANLTGKEWFVVQVRTISFSLDVGSPRPDVNARPKKVSKSFKATS